jgi:subtilisin family serine protease
MTFIRRALQTLSTLAMTAMLSTLGVSAYAAEPHQQYLISSTGTINSAQGQVRAAGGTVLETFPAVEVLLVRLPARAVTALNTAPGIRIAPDLPLTLERTQTPSPSWGLDRIDQRDLPLSGTAVSSPARAGEGVWAYIVDSGIRSTHSEFAGRVAPGMTRINDGLGTEDCDGHGTHVAGTVAGATYGVAPQATLIPLRVFGCPATGNTSDLIAAMDWAVAHHPAGQPAVMNLSLSAGASTFLIDPVNRVVADGIVVVAAAGNDGKDACSTYPAAAPNAISVGATTSTDAKPSWSNFGPCLDLFAPGSGIISAYYTGDTTTRNLSGTSMAAPHVAGAIALLVGADPTLTPAAARAALNAATTPNKVTSAGTGSPNRLLYTNPLDGLTVPQAPTEVTTTSVAATSMQVSWTAPTETGGTPITGYVITYTPTGGTPVSASAAASPVTLTGLAQGTTYTVGVAAINAVGTSASTTTTATTLVAVAPGAPTSAAISLTTNTSATVTWAAPTSTGTNPLTGYTVTVRNASTGATVATASVTASTLSRPFTGLTAGVTYRAGIQAVSAAGSSAEALTGTVTTLAAPSSARNLIFAVTGVAALTSTWVAPLSDGGSPITGYTLTLRNVGTGAIVSTINVSSATVAYTYTGLTVGTSYAVAVVARNAVGTAPTVTSATVKAATTPAIVRSVKVSYPRTLATSLSWAAPSSDGGSPIVRYEVRHTTTADTTSWSAWTSTGTARSATITGIAKGVTRYAQIRAVTAAGAGSPVQVTIRPTI